MDDKEKLKITLPIKCSTIKSIHNCKRWIDGMIAENTGYEWCSIGEVFPLVVFTNGTEWVCLIVYVLIGFALHLEHHPILDNAFVAIAIASIGNFVLWCWIYGVAKFACIPDAETKGG